MVTNLTNLTSTTDVYGVVKFVNDVTQGTFIIMFMSSLFFIFLMMSLRRYEFDEALTVSAFLCFGISIFFTAIHLLSFYYVVTFGVITALGGFWLYLARN